MLYRKTGTNKNVTKQIPVSKSILKISLEGILAVAGHMEVFHESAVFLLVFKISTCKLGDVNIPGNLIC